MKIHEIKEFPTLVNNTHESIYQSYQILELVLEMLKRGDSHETILMVINEIQNVKN